MALPTTPASRWLSDLQRPFQLLEGFDAYDDYELYEEEDEFVLTIEMLGFDVDEISVAWDDGVLNIAAEHTDDDRGRQKMYHRRFRFPKAVDDEAIAAAYNNGVLEVTLPLGDGATVHGEEIPIEG